MHRYRKDGRRCHGLFEISRPDINILPHSPPLPRRSHPLPGHASGHDATRRFSARAGFDCASVSEQLVKPPRSLPCKAQRYAATRPRPMSSLGTRLHMLQSLRRCERVRHVVVIWLVAAMDCSESSLRCQGFSQS